MLIGAGTSVKAVSARLDWIHNWARAVGAPMVTSSSLGLPSMYTELDSFTFDRLGSETDVRFFG